MTEDEECLHECAILRRERNTAEVRAKELEEDLISSRIRREWLHRDWCDMRQKFEDLQKLVGAAEKKLGKKLEEL